MTKVVVHKPEQARIGNLATVARFYERLQEALSARFDVAMIEQPFPPPALGELAPDCLHITYHTRHAGPNVINAKIGYLADYFYFDDGGYSGWSMLAGTDLGVNISDDEAEHYYAMQILPRIASGASKYAQPPMSAVAPAPGYLAIFTQVQGDTVLELAWSSSREMVTALLREARERNLHAVLKLHPRCADTEFRAFAAREAERYGARLVDLNVHQIIAGASCVAAVNSGAGFEALCHLKPVLSFGASDYLAAAIPIRAQKDIGPALALADQSEAFARRTKRFLCGYLNAQVCVDDPDFASIVTERVERKLATGALLAGIK